MNFIAPLKLQSRVVVTGASPTKLYVNLGQMPSHPDISSYSFTIKPVSVDVGVLGGCRYMDTVPVTGTYLDGHNATFQVTIQVGGRPD